MEVTVSEMKQLEQAADAHGLSYPQMMENAGQAATRILQAECPRTLRTAAILCGNGNNGGDGFVVARALHAAGCQVEVLLAEGQPKTPDAQTNLAQVQALGIPVTPLADCTPDRLARIRQADVVVDALYGTGFHGALRPAGRQACDCINASNGYKLALDLPSGLAADTGIPAEGAVQADLTVTFHAAKPCHRLNPAQCGKVVVASIGIEQVL